MKRDSRSRASSPTVFDGRGVQIDTVACTYIVMTDTNQSPQTVPRPWTPTERPGDASYSTVVYHGDHRDHDVESDSEVSEDEKEASQPPLSPGGIEVDLSDRTQENPKSKLFSSQALDPDPGSAPETHSYLAYMGTPTRPRVEEDEIAKSQQQLEQRIEQPSQVRPSSRQDKSETKDELPSVTGKSSRLIKILLINPNSTRSMTEQCLESISNTLPSDVIVYGFTPSRPAPTAIESSTDAIMSTAACAKAVLPVASQYDAFLVACFSHHPLIATLREQLAQPVIGIMEAGLYASRMCSSKFGVLTTGVRSMYTIDGSIKNEYGLGQFSVGCESSRMGVLDLESLPEDVVNERLATTATRLQLRGADSIVLGCAGMTDLKRACEDAVGMHDRVAMVIDGVAMGVHFLIGLVREGLGTAKGGPYNTYTGHKRLSKVES